MKTVTIRDNGLGDCEVQDALDAKPGEYVPIAEVRKLRAERDVLLAACRCHEEADRLRIEMEDERTSPRDRDAAQDRLKEIEAIFSAALANTMD